MEKVKGIVFPVPHKFIAPIFSGKKDVFIKLRVGRFKLLKAKQKIIFYDSGIHKLVGQAKILSIHIDKPNIIWEMYGNRIFLEKKDFEKYIKISPLGHFRNLERSKLTAIVYSNPHKYSKPKESHRRMTIAGFYLR